MIYFLHGEDSFRSKVKLNEIVEGYKRVHKSGLNLIYLDAGGNDFTDFFNNFRTTSMFAEKKMVILKNLFSAKGAASAGRQGPAAGWQDKFLENINNIKNLKDIIVIYESGAVDQRTKFFKALQKSAKCQEFKFLQPAQLRRWVIKEFEKNKAKINPDALSLLLAFVGNNLWQMNNEIKKLSNYKKDFLIEKSDVEDLIKPNIENDIFKTIEALASKNKKQALLLLHKHLDEGDSCLYLLSMIAYQFKNLLIIKELQEKNKRYPVIVKTSGLHPFVVKKNYYLCNKFSFAELKKIYQKIFQIDLDIKTGKVDSELALDMLVASV